MIVSNKLGKTNWKTQYSFRLKVPGNKKKRKNSLTNVITEKFCHLERKNEDFPLRIRTKQAWAAVASPCWWLDCPHRNSKTSQICLRMNGLLPSYWSCPCGFLRAWHECLSKRSAYQSFLSFACCGPTIFNSVWIERVTLYALEF